VFESGAFTVGVSEIAEGVVDDDASALTSGPDPLEAVSVDVSLRGEAESFVGLSGGFNEVALS